MDAVNLTNLDPVQMQRLLSSAGGRAYLTELVDLYWQVSGQLDAAPQDQRYWQGAKEFLRRAIEMPYTVAQQPSPLAQTHAVRRQRKRRDTGQNGAEIVQNPHLLVRNRPSYLA